MATLVQTWRRASGNDQLVLFLLAVVIGITAGYGALLLRLLIEDPAEAAFQAPVAPPATARDLVRRVPEVLVPQDDLEAALRSCETNQEEHLPVVEDRHGLKMIGEVRYQDPVLACDRALLAARAAERGDG